MIKEEKNDSGYSVYCVARPSVIRFAEKMERKLREKDEERGEEGWLDADVTISFLLSRLKEEIGEMENAFDNCDCRAITEECVDVANFAMMIWDRLHKNWNLKL